MHKMSLIIAGALLLSTSLPSYADVLSIATPSSIQHLTLLKAFFARHVECQ